jgi:hypothetical protein
MSSLGSFSGKFDISQVAPNSRHQLARALDFDDYFSVARIHDLNNGFWDGLFANALSRQGTIVVFETRLGTVSSALAQHFHHVISCHLNISAAAATKAWLATCGISNVSVRVGDESDQFQISESDVVAMVMIGPDADPTGQWGMSGEVPLRLLLSIARQKLRPEGQIVIMDNNRLAYKAADNPRRGQALLPLKLRMDREFSCSEILVCGAPLTTSHSPPPDFFNRLGTSDSSNLPKSWWSKLKRKLLSQPTARLFWPSFLMIVSKVPSSSFFSELLGQLRNASALGWIATEQIVIKRIVAGNTGTSIVIAGPAAHNLADIVIRLPSNEKGEQLCRVNAQALADMAASSLAPLVPRLIDQGVFGGRPYFVETRCPGYEVYSGTQGLAQMVQSACGIMSVLHRQSTVRSVISTEDFDKRIAPLFADVESYCSSEIAGRLQILSATLRTRMKGKTVSLGVTHGDFKLGNILFDERGKFSALIDWDGYSTSGFQLFDYLTLLTYKMSYDADCSMAKVYMENLLPWKLPDYYATLVDEALSGLTIDEESFLYVRIVFWFALLNVRFDGVYKFHRRWHDEFLEPVLREVELALKR